MDISLRPCAGDLLKIPAEATFAGLRTAYSIYSRLWIASVVSMETIASGLVFITITTDFYCLMFQVQHKITDKPRAKGENKGRIYIYKTIKVPWSCCHGFPRRLQLKKVTCSE